MAELRARRASCHARVRGLGAGRCLGGGPSAWWSVLGPSAESRGASTGERVLPSAEAALRGRPGGGAP
eukprot:978646-Pyramimonas_sp.AAC.1